MKNPFKELKETKQRLASKKKLLALIDDARLDLWRSRSSFNEVNENDMIEYFIYERRAHELRYLHLLNLYKSAGFDSASDLSDETAV